MVTGMMFWQGMWGRIRLISEVGEGGMGCWRSEWMHSLASSGPSLEF